MYGIDSISLCLIYCTSRISAFTSSIEIFITFFCFDHFLRWCSEQRLKCLLYRLALFLLDGFLIFFNISFHFGLDIHLYFFFDTFLYQYFWFYSSVSRSVIWYCLGCSLFFCSRVFVVCMHGCCRLFGFAFRSERSSVYSATVLFCSRCFCIISLCLTVLRSLVVLPFRFLHGMC